MTDSWICEVCKTWSPEKYRSCHACKVGKRPTVIKLPSYSQETKEQKIARLAQTSDLYRAVLASKMSQS